MVDMICSSHFSKNLGTDLASAQDRLLDRCPLCALRGPLGGGLGAVGDAKAGLVAEGAQARIMLRARQGDLPQHVGSFKGVNQHT